MEKLNDWLREQKADRETGRKTEAEIDGETGGESYRQTDRVTNRNSDGEIKRQREIKKKYDDKIDRELTEI